jgi:Arc/MetJ family transcription regulator
MQITLDLDEALFTEALQLTKLTTQEDMIHLAVAELVRSRKKKNLLDLAGQIQFVADFDHKGGSLNDRIGGDRNFRDCEAMP